jgi:hypothetical protein
MDEGIPIVPCRDRLLLIALSAFFFVSFIAPPKPVAI